MAGLEIIGLNHQIVPYVNNQNNQLIQYIRGVQYAMNYYQRNHEQISSAAHQVVQAASGVAETANNIVNVAAPVGTYALNSLNPVREQLTNAVRVGLRGIYGDEWLGVAMQGAGKPSRTPAGPPIVQKLFGPRPRASTKIPRSTFRRTAMTNYRKRRIYKKR